MVLTNIQKLRREINNQEKNNLKKNKNKDKLLKNKNLNKSNNITLMMSLNKIEE